MFESLPSLVFDSTRLLTHDRNKSAETSQIVPDLCCVTRESQARALKSWVQEWQSYTGFDEGPEAALIISLSQAKQLTFSI